MTSAIDPASPPRVLTLIHLSDIHLSEEEILSSQDLDFDLRKKLLADLRDERLGLADGVDGVLLTGDIAYAAKAKEYESAHEFLKDLCAQIGCPPSNVWSVPGNHDAAWSKMSTSILDIHEVVRAKNQQDRLRERLVDSGASTMLLAPFHEYNTFARQFGCSTDATAPHWEFDGLRLNDGSVLRLRGINSALVSDRRDKALGKPAQVLGLKQLQLSDDDDGVAYLTLCHHPPSYAHDQDSVEDHLNSRARVQLFGHDHRYRPRQVENSLIIFAGALHPNRGEDEWEPRYNIIKLAVVGPPRQLAVEVLARVWKPAETRFGPDVDSRGNHSYKCSLTLPPWQASSIEVLATTSETMPVVNAPSPTVTPLRDIVYDFFEVTYPARLQVLIDLKLVEPEDSDVSEQELIRRAIDRARNTGLLESLATALRKVLTTP